MSEETKVLPPQNREAEEALLGSLLIDPDALFRVQTEVQPGYFYGGEGSPRGQIYAAMLALDASKQPIDIRTISAEIKDFKNGGDESIEVYLIGLLGVVPTSINVEAYAKIVQDCFVRRNMIRDARKAANAAFDTDVPLSQILLDISAAHQVTAGVISKKPVSLNEVCQRILDTVLGDIPPPYIYETGFMDLDKILGGGFRSGDYVCVAARPGMGKTAMMMRLAINLAEKGKSVGVYSMEMLPVDLVSRMVSMYTGIETKRVLSSSLQEQEQQMVFAALDKINRLPIHFLEIGDRTIGALRATCSTVMAEHGLDVLMVDYLQLMRGHGVNRVEQVTELSNGLKSLALELRIPAVVLSQLNRGVESRNDKRPTLSDLRDSGSIEQDSDMVMFLYRDDYYNAELSERPNIAEVNVAKHRNGPTGVADLYWMAHRADLKNLQRQEISL